MYLRRCSMSSISEESETGDDDKLIKDQQQNEIPKNNLNVENCLGDLNNFKEVKFLFFRFIILFSYICIDAIWKSDVISIIGNPGGL